MLVPDLADLYERCVRGSGHDRVCEEFFACVKPLLIRIAGRVAAQFSSPCEVDDIVQEINLKLASSGNTMARLLPKDPSAAAAYISVVAANTARDFFRSRNAGKRGAQRTIHLDSFTLIAGPVETEAAVERSLLFSQIEECLIHHQQRESAVFRLYYRQGFTAREIASIPALNLTVKGVESMIHRITTDVRRRIGNRVPAEPFKGKSAHGTSKE